MINKTIFRHSNSETETDHTRRVVTKLNLPRIYVCFDIK